jgi:hypothetical protein
VLALVCEKLKNVRVAVGGDGVGVAVGGDGVGVAVGGDGVGVAVGGDGVGVAEPQLKLLTMDIPFILAVLPANIK